MNKNWISKYAVCLLVVLPVLLTSCGTPTVEPNNIDVTESVELSDTDENGNFVIPFNRGVNLSGLEYSAYSTWFWSRNAYFKDNTIYEGIIKEGFDHVRLPVDLRLYYDASTKQLNSNISDLDRILGDIIKSGLFCCLDFHGWYDINTDDA